MLTQFKHLYNQWQERRSKPQPFRSIRELVYYLEHEPPKVPRHQWNEVLLMAYQLLLPRVFQDMPDHLIVTDTNWIWQRSSNIIGSYETTLPVKRRVSYRSELRKLITYDRMLQRHIRVVAMTIEQDDYHIRVRNDNMSV